MSIQGLKILVIVMGVLIVIGMAVVIATIISRARGLSQTPVGFGTVTAQLPAGADIRDMAVSDGQVILHIDGPAGPEIRVFDLTTGEARGIIQLEGAP